MDYDTDGRDRLKHLIISFNFKHCIKGTLKSYLTYVALRSLSLNQMEQFVKRSAQ